MCCLFNFPKRSHTCAVYAFVYEFFSTIHRRELLRVWRVDWNGYIKMANDQSEWKEYVNIYVCVCVWVFTLYTANNAWHILQIHMISFVAVCSYFLKRKTNDSWIFLDTSACICFFFIWVHFKSAPCNCHATVRTTQDTAMNILYSLVFWF